MDIDFDFKLIPCKFLNLKIEDIEKFTILEWNSFGEAVAMAYEFETGRVRDNNILIDWKTVESQ